MDKINWKWIVGVGLSALLIGVITGSTNVTGPKCAIYAIDTAFDMYFDVGRNSNQMLDISFESDTTSLGDVDTDIQLSICTGTNPQAQGDSTKDNCTPFMFDTDADGLGDSDLLTMGSGFTIEDIGVRGISGFRYLRARRSGDPVDSTQLPVLTVCRRSF